MKKRGNIDIYAVTSHELKESNFNTKSAKLCNVMSVK